MGHVVYILELLGVMTRVETGAAAGDGGGIKELQRAALLASLFRHLLPSPRFPFGLDSSLHLAI